MLRYVTAAGIRGSYNAKRGKTALASFSSKLAAIFKINLDFNWPNPMTPLHHYVSYFVVMIFAFLLQRKAT